MSSSPVKPHILWLFVLAFAVPVVVSGAKAQSGDGPRRLDAPARQSSGSAAAEPAPPVSAPRRLIPSSNDDATAARGNVYQPSSSTTAPSASGQPEKTGIQVQGVGAIDSESVGAYGPGNGGLGIDMWRGTARQNAIYMIESLPNRLGYRSLRDLATRLLLSRAQAPIARNEDAPSLLAARAKKLLALGDIEGARLLLAVAPKNGRPQALDAIDATLNLLRYDNAHSCGLARRNRDRASSDFWQRLLVYCDALDGKAESANFGLSLLRETGEDDAAMALLSDAILSDSNVTLETIESPKPVHFAMTRAANTDLPGDIADSDDPMILYGAAKAPNLLLGRRIEAAERAVGMGVLDPADLRDLYKQVQYSDEDRANALTRADEIGGPAARALLYQAATSQNVPAARAEIISSALDYGRDDGRYRATVEAFRPLIDRLPPSPEMVWFALRGVRAFLVLGEPVGTDRWLALLRASANIREESAVALDRIRPLARMIGAGDRRQSLETVLDGWRQGLDAGPETVARRELMNGLFMALYETLPANAWDDIPARGLYPQKLPSMRVWIRLRAEMQEWQARRGDVPRRATGTAGLSQVASVSSATPQSGAAAGVAVPTLLSLQAMGDGGPGAQGIAVVFEVVSALHTLGFESAARRLAVETALAAGL